MILHPIGRLITEGQICNLILLRERILAAETMQDKKHLYERFTFQKFDYDCIFLPSGNKCTMHEWSEMPMKKYQCTKWRVRILELITFCVTLFTKIRLMILIIVITKDTSIQLFSFIYL